jgi:hypothetical protein
LLYVGFDVHTSVTVKSMVIWVIRREVDISEELVASIFRVEE